jgi:para-nitrobenzyl esterase
MFVAEEGIMDSIRLDTGSISGIKVTEKGQEISVFRGIPYAAPPTGELRWKPPQPAIPWSGVRECTKFSIQTAQYPDIHASDSMQKMLSSEDSLYLNVMTPAKKTTDKLPVMVWFHGGGTRYGNGNLPISNSLGLPGHGVVLVTTNHRLGILGLFAHPLISRESPRGVSGNYLFLDMVASLQWVKKNIAAFGGDPDNVTIFGQSGGGLKVAALIASPLAAGLFQRAIIQSGGRDFNPAKLKDLEEYGNRYFTKLGVDKKKDPLSAARAISWEKIVEVEQALNTELGREYQFMGPWTLAEDGWFMPDSILNLFRTGKRNLVPYLVVADMGELTGPGLVIADGMIANYLILLGASGKATSRGYAAVFDRVPDNWRKEGCVAAHGMELHYMFGSLDVAEGWNAHFGGFALSGAKSPVPTISNVDRKVSEAMLNIWAQFAGTGNPSVKGLIEWPAWDKPGDKYLYIGDDLTIKSGYSGLTKIQPKRIGITL